jgi:predicted O-methyltransferase YrrM
MAQALEDAGVESRVLTVERDEGFQAIARENVEAAGLSHRVSFHLGGSIAFLRELDRIDFLYLDDNHVYEHVVAELDVVDGKLVEGGSVYFDNTLEGGVAEALKTIPERYGGNIVHFRNCSLGPPGNAIWQR